MLDPVKHTRKGSLASLASLASLTSPVDQLDDVAVVDSDDAASPILTPRDSLQNHKPSTLTLTRSHESGPNSRSPERRTRGRHNGAGEAGAVPSAPVRRRSERPERSASRSLSSAPAPSSPQPNTPLLMPPPATFLGEVQHRTRLAQHLVATSARRHAEALAFLFRTALFLVKMATLARPCWPFVAQWEVGAPLVVIAGLDMGLPSSTSSSSSSAARFQQEGAQQYRHRYRQSAPPFWGWNWRVSVFLLALHVLVLWTASHSGVLCAVNSHETWAGW